MEKSIQFSGLNRAIPQSNAPDGACQELINARFRKGCWRPIGRKTDYKTLTTIDTTKIYLHDIEGGLNDGQPNWIGYDSSTAQLSLINPEDDTFAVFASFGAPGSKISVTFLKRTLIVCSDYGVYVYLWTTDYTTDPVTKHYVQTTVLPVPDVDLSTTNTTYETTAGSSDADVAIGNFYAMLNNQSSNDGRLYGSIMYITAYKMFDGSYILPSVPRYLEISNNTTLSGGSFYLQLAGIKATINNELYPDTISDTKDLIESVCVFSTNTFTLHKLDKTTVLLGEPLILNPEFANIAKSAGWYKILEFSFEDIVGKTGRTTKDCETKNFYQNYATRETLPTDQFTHHQMLARVAYVYNDRLHLANIKTSLGSPYVYWPDNYGNYSPRGSEPIPGKLSVFVKTALGKAIKQSYIDVPVYRTCGTNNTDVADPDEGNALIALMEAFTDPSYADYIPGSGYLSVTETYVNIGTGEYDVMVPEYHYQVIWMAYSLDGTPYYILPSVIGYNDARAYRMQITITIDEVDLLLFDESLTKNVSMNFATWNNKSFDIDETLVTANYPSIKYPTADIVTLATPPAEIELPYDTNRLQVSEIQNPLFFPTKNSYQVGTGSILGIMAGSEPLSIGQFGGFPLQVFHTKGIHTMSIGTGNVLYLNILPVNGEVINNADNLLPIGSGVIYTTDKGIFVINGMQVTEIGEIAEGEPYTAITNLPEILSLIDDAETNTHFTPALHNSLSDINLLTYMLGSVIGYDHLNKELIIANSTKAYSYVFSFESKLWFKISQSYTLLINAYPKLYGATGTNIVSISEEVEDETTSVLIVTCAQSLQLPDVYKRIERAILRTKYESSVGNYPGLYVFESNDLTTWQLSTGKQRTGEIKDLMIQRSHGSAKYFMFVFNGNLSFTSELKQFDILFKTKWNNRLR